MDLSSGRIVKLFKQLITGPEWLGINARDFMNRGGWGYLEVARDRVFGAKYGAGGYHVGEAMAGQFSSPNQGLFSNELPSSTPSIGGGGGNIIGAIVGLVANVVTNLIQENMQNKLDKLNLQAEAAEKERASWNNKRRQIQELRQQEVQNHTRTNLLIYAPYANLANGVLYKKGAPGSESFNPMQAYNPAALIAGAISANAVGEMLTNRAHIKDAGNIHYNYNTNLIYAKFSPPKNTVQDYILENEKTIDKAQGKAYREQCKKIAEIVSDYTNAGINTLKASNELSANQISSAFKYAKAFYRHPNRDDLKKIANHCIAIYEATGQAVANYLYKEARREAVGNAHFYDTNIFLIENQYYNRGERLPIFYKRRVKLT